MTEKRKPIHELDAIQSAFSSAENLNATGSAIRSAMSLGFSKSRIVGVI